MDLISPSPNKSMESNFTQEEAEPWSPSSEFPLTAFYLTLLLLALLGLVMSSFGLYKSIRKTKRSRAHQWIISSICFSDLLAVLLIFVQFVLGYHILDIWYHFSFVLSGFLSVFLLAVHQFRVVREGPAHDSTWTGTRGLVCIWILSLLLGTRQFFFSFTWDGKSSAFEDAHSKQGGFTGLLTPHAEVSPVFGVWITAQWIFTAILQPILAVIVAFLYFMIFQRIQQVLQRSYNLISRNNNASDAPESLQNQATDELKSPALIVSRALYFIFVWFSFSISVIWLLWIASDPNIPSNPWLNLSFVLVPVLNAIVNPHLYAFRHWDDSIYALETAN